MLITLMVLTRSLLLFRGELTTLLISLITLCSLIRLGLRTTSSIFLAKDTGLDVAGTLLSLITIAVAVACILISLTRNKQKAYWFLFLLISRVRVKAFCTRRSLLFYIFFEVRLIPILLIILGWGYQPERLPAGTIMLFYTILGSIPLLSIVALRSTFSFWRVSQVIDFHSVAGKSSALTQLIITIAFLVKLPIFISHIWLPKAHTEAPVAGSIFLAATLLKLGGCGLLRFGGALANPWVNSFLIAISLSGLLWVGGICVITTDIKVIIAYSSVAHIGLRLGALACLSRCGILACLLILLTHRASSSYMFMQSFISYSRVGRRNILLNKGLGAWSPSFCGAWFLACLGILGAPPTANILSEIITFLALVSQSTFSAFILVVGAVLAGAYSLSLFAITFQGVNNSANRLKPINSLELMLMLYHSFWLVLIAGLVNTLFC